jgi:dipeptidyl aminopeptidase/acylaminoacyl peptidase
MQRPSDFRTLPIGPRADLAGPAWLLHAQANTALAWASSPAAYLHQLTSPLLVIQGDSDANVDFQESAGIVVGSLDLLLITSCVLYISRGVYR